MKLYTEEQVKDLLEIQRENCYIAILNNKGDHKIAKLAKDAKDAMLSRTNKSYGIDAKCLFKEDIEDKSLQKNLESFQKAKEHAKISYNGIVPSLNSLIDQIAEIKSLIVTLSSQKLSTEEAVKKLSKLNISFNELSERANTYALEIDAQDVLIKNYKDWTERKLFMHWSYLTHLQVTDKPWLEWKEQYNGYII